MWPPRAGTRPSHLLLPPLLEPAPSATHSLSTPSLSPWPPPPPLLSPAAPPSAFAAAARRSHGHHLSHAPWSCPRAPPRSSPPPHRASRRQKPRKRRRHRRVHRRAPEIVAGDSSSTGLPRARWTSLRHRCEPPSVSPLSPQSIPSSSQSSHPSRELRVAGHGTAVARARTSCSRTRRHPPHLSRSRNHHQILPMCPTATARAHPSFGRRQTRRRRCSGHSPAKPSPRLDAGEHQLPVASLRVANEALWAKPTARRRVWPRRPLNSGRL